MNFEDLLGQTVSTPVGDLILQKVLGHGSFAIVYLATCQNHHQYAVKVLFKKNLSTEQLQIQRMECDLHKRVSDHPNIVKLYHIIEDEECLYLVLDYWRNGDLFDALVSQSMESYFDEPKKVFALFLQIVSALEHCHSKGVYHRDLKPENILLRRYRGEWHAAVADFGLATDSDFSIDFACGSVRYMSPECLQETNSEGYSTKSNDVWALGIILINLLTRKNPWTEPTSDDPMFEEWMAKGSTKRSELLAEQFGFSRSVSHLLSRCFELNWRLRLSVSELKSAVEKLIETDSQIFAEQEQVSDEDTTLPIMPEETEVGFSWADDIESALQEEIALSQHSSKISDSESLMFTSKKQNKDKKKRSHQQLTNATILAKEPKQPSNTIIAKEPSVQFVNTLHWVVNRIFSVDLDSEARCISTNRNQSHYGLIVTSLRN